MILSFQEIMALNEELALHNLKVSVTDACGGQSLYFKSPLTEEQLKIVEDLFTTKGYKISWFPGNRYFELD